MDIDFYNQKRKDLKLTVDDLAKKAGISRRTLTGILRQEPKYSNPTIDTIQKIERALGLSDITDEEAAQSMQVSSLTWKWSLPIEMAPTGHSPSQVPQEMQASEITLDMVVSSFLTL